MKKAFFISIILALGTMLFACSAIPAENGSFNGAASSDELTAPLAPPGRPNVIDSENPVGERNGEQNEAPGVIPNENPIVSSVKPLGNKAVYVRAKTDGLNVREGAGTGCASLGTLDKGDMAVCLGESNGWYKTYYRSKVAYVSASEKYTDLYTTDKGSDEIEAVIDVGLKLLGTPYVYGATRYHNGSGKKLTGFSIDAFDCSSLMQYMYYIGADVKLDLTTRTQISQGRKVSELKRGDLMFFTNASRKDKTGIERVGHVALYLGDNYILHTASDHAVIEEISSTRWSYYIQANRMI